MLALYHVDREELIRIILAQHAEIAIRDRQLAAQAAELVQLRAMIGHLSERLGKLEQSARDDPPSSTGTPHGMPGVKATETAARGARSRKRREQGYGRQRMTATERVVHALVVCPNRATPLAGGSIKRTREVIDLPLLQVIVTEHVYLERRCPVCGNRCVPPPELAGW